MFCQQQAGKKSPVLMADLLSCWLSSMGLHLLNWGYLLMRGRAGTQPAWSPLSRYPHGRGLALGWPKRDVAEKKHVKKQGAAGN